MKTIISSLLIAVAVAACGGSNAPESAQQFDDAFGRARLDAVEVSGALLDSIVESAIALESQQSGRAAAKAEQAAKTDKDSDYDMRVRIDELVKSHAAELTTKQMPAMRGWLLKQAEAGQQRPNFSAMPAMTPYDDVLGTWPNLPWELDGYQSETEWNAAGHNKANRAEDRRRHRFDGLQGEWENFGSDIRKPYTMDAQRDELKAQFEPQADGYAALRQRLEAENASDVNAQLIGYFWRTCKLRESKGP